MLSGWRAVLLLTVFLQFLGFGIVLPLLPYYGRSLGADAVAIGALFAVYSLTQFLLAPFWGALADRVGRRPVLLASIAWGFVAYLLFAVAESYGVLLLSRFLAGLSAAVIGVSQAYLADRTPAEERAGGMGLLGAAFGMGFVVGPALGALLSGWGFAAPGFFAAALTAVNFALALRWLSESLPAEHRSEARPVVHPLRGLRARRVPGLRGVLAILFLTTAAFSVLYPVFPLFVEARFGFGPLEAGILFSLVGLASVGVQAGALGPLARWSGERRLLGLGALTMALGLALLPFCQSPPALVLALVPIALGFAVTTPIAQTLLSRLSPPAEQARNLGVGHSLASLARACGPLAGGVLFDRLGTAFPFWAATLLLLAAFALARRLPVAGGERASRPPSPLQSLPVDAAVLAPETGTAPAPPSGRTASSG
jgi:DHA1 family tetracycline resistance protein-like MFS transporter